MLDRREDLVSGLGPDEGFGVAVLDVDVVAEGALQFKRTAMRTPRRSCRLVSSAKKRST
jgi:hypothetical protein